MIDIHSKHDNMHKNGMFYALICIKNHIITCIDCMLSNTLWVLCKILCLVKDYQIEQKLNLDLI